MIHWSSHRRVVEGTICYGPVLSSVCMQKRGPLNTAGQEKLFKQDLISFLFSIDFHFWQQRGLFVQGQDQEGFLEVGVKRCWRVVTAAALQGPLSLHAGRSS